MNSDSSKHIPLLKRIADGKEAALSELYELYSGALFGSILQIAGSEEAAAEILQDVFLKIWNQAGTYQPEKAKPFTWMLRIARNAAIDYRRSAVFSKNLKTDALDSSVYEQEEASDVLHEPFLEKIMHKLNPEQKQVVQAIYFQGYSHGEFAEVSGIPLGTVKTRVRAALQTLRRWLGDE